MDNKSLGESINHKLHDIRNPLGTISMNAELASIIIDRDMDMVKVKSLLSVIVEQCSECSRILDSLQHKPEGDAEQ